MTKKSLHALWALLMITLLAGACSSDNSSSVAVTSDCAIKGFTLGQLRRQLHTTASTGEDSTYVISFSGSLYPLTIDQVNRTITNAEPLPMGTQLAAALCTISADGLVVYAPAADTTEWTAYASADSIDFSQPLLFRSYAYDGSGYREYSLSLTVRPDNPAEFTWQQLGSLPAMAQRTAARLLVRGTQALLLSRSADGRCYCATTATDHPAWTEQPCTGLTDEADLGSAQVFGGALWMTTTGGLLLRSDDGSSWQLVEQPAEGTALSLFAASETALYALTSTADGAAVATSADGTTWETVPVEQGAAFAATAPFTAVAAAVAYEQPNGNRRVLLAADAAATGSDAATLCIWNRLEGSGEGFTLFTVEGNSSAYQLPRWQHPVLLSYNGWLVALGDADLSGTHTPLDQLLVSYDSGLNWRTNDQLAAPADLQGTAGPVTAAVAGEYIWLLAADQLWRLRYNGYGM